MKRLLFWFLLAAFAAVCGWYSFYFPCRLGRLYRAIPMDARFISEHQRLGDRWQTFAANAVVRTIARTAGVTNAAIDEFSANPETDRLMRRLAPGRTLVAYVPAMGRTRQPAWVAVSWVGAYSQILKMEMALRLVPGFRRVRLDGGREAWELKGGLPRRAERLSMAVVEGVLYACLSRDPRGVQYLIQRVDSAAPLVPELQSRLDAETRPGNASVPLDRGWWFGYQEERGVLTLRRLHVDVDVADRALLKGRVRGTWSLPGSIVPASGQGGGASELASVLGGTDGLARVLGDFPGVLAVVPFADVKPYVMKESETGNVELVRAFLRTNVSEQGAAFVCFGGTNYSGRIFGFRAPALLAGVQVQDPAAVHDMIAGALDELNARRRLGLIASTIQVGDQPVTVLEGLTPSVYRELAPSERVAFTVKSGWLIFSSNLDALTNLITRGGVAASPAWPKSVAAAHPRSLLWMDLVDARDILTKSLAVYDLMSYARSLQRPTGKGRQQWETFRQWMEALSDAGTLSVWVEPDASSPEQVLHFVLGPARGESPP